MGDRTTAANFFNQAVTAINDHGNPDRLKLGYQLFSSACMADPTWSEGWYQAGNNNSDLGLEQAAIACWRRALQCEISCALEARTLCNLAWRLHTQGFQHEALLVAKHAAELDGNLAMNWVNLSCIYQVLHQHTEMVQAAELAYSLHPEDPVVEVAYAFALLFGRKLQDGFCHFEARFPYKLKSYLQFPYPKWLGEPDKTVYLVADQGLGDTLSFARFVPAAARRAKYLHMLIQPELMRLFSHAFVALPNVNLIPQPAPFPPADCWSTFVSLPFALQLPDSVIRAAVPIAAPSVPVPSNWKVPDRKLHVGITWTGSELNEINKHRSIPVSQFFPLADVPGVQLYAFQVDRHAQDMYDAGGAAFIRDLAPYCRDVVDTVSLLKHLDLVITCESAMGHICGMIGKECWIPYSYLGKDYRLGTDGKDPFWYPRHRIFRQGNDRRWDLVLDQIEAALRERLDAAAHQA
jgi:hypothetical protein